jgi:hypothetical protein
MPITATLGKEREAIAWDLNNIMAMCRGIWLK